MSLSLSPHHRCETSKKGPRSSQTTPQSEHSPCQNVVRCKTLPQTVPFPSLPHFLTWHGGGHTLTPLAHTSARAHTPPYVGLLFVCLFLKFTLSHTNTRWPRGLRLQIFSMNHLCLFFSFFRIHIQPSVDWQLGDVLFL